MLSSLIEYETPKVVTVHNISIGETSVSYQQAIQAQWGNTGEKRFKSFISTVYLRYNERCFSIFS